LRLKVTKIEQIRNDSIQPPKKKEKLTTSSLGFLLLLSIGLDTVQEFLTTLGVSDVFNTDVNTLFNVAVTNDLVNNDTNRGLGNVIDDTSTTTHHESISFFASKHSPKLTHGKTCEAYPFGRRH
jgi:hypothetical protein